MSRGARYHRPPHALPLSARRDRSRSKRALLGSLLAPQHERLRMPARPRRAPRFLALLRWMRRLLRLRCARPFTKAAPSRVRSTRMPSTSPTRITASSASLPSRPAATTAIAVPMPGAPAQVLALADRVLVTVRDPGLLLRAPARRRATASSRSARVALPADAWGVAVTPDEKTAIVTSAWTHQVSAVDLDVHDRTLVGRRRARAARDRRARRRRRRVRHPPRRRERSRASTTSAGTPSVRASTCPPRRCARRPGRSLDGVARLRGRALGRRSAPLRGAPRARRDGEASVVRRLHRRRAAHGGRRPARAASLGSAPLRARRQGRAGDRREPPRRVPLAPFTQPRAIVYRQAHALAARRRRGDDCVVELDALAVDPTLAIAAHLHGRQRLRSASPRRQRLRRAERGSRSPPTRRRFGSSVDRPTISPTVHLDPPARGPAPGPRAAVTIAAPRRRSARCEPRRRPPHLLQRHRSHHERRPRLRRLPPRGPRRRPRLARGEVLDRRRRARELRRRAPRTCPKRIASRAFPRRTPMLAGRVGAPMAPTAGTPRARIWRTE